MSILIYLPTVLLLFYPIKCFRKLLSYCGPKKYHAICVFIDTFQGHYKDGTNGTRDYRAASCISFILRIPAYHLLITSNHYGGTNLKNKLSLLFGFILTSLFYGLVQPCKRRYMNNIESTLYCAAGLILTYFGEINYNSQDYSRYIISNLCLTVTFLPSIILLCYLVLYRMFKLNHLKLVFNTLFNKLFFRQDDSTHVAVADRLVNPLNYTPLQ